MKFILKSVALFTLLCTLMYSCQKDEVISANPETTQKIPKEVLLKIAKLGVNPYKVKAYTLTKELGTKESGWLANDIFFQKMT